MHLDGFSIRSNFWQESEMVFRASAWSLEEDEMMVISSANPLTLCGLEQLTCRGGSLKSFIGQYHLSVPRAGCHFSSVGLIVSVKFHFVVFQADWSMIFAGHNFGKVPACGLTRVGFIQECINIGLDLRHRWPGAWHPQAEPRCDQGLGQLDYWFEGD